MQLDVGSSGKPLPLREIWRERIADFSTSGESRRAYCKRQSLSYDQFQYWYHQLGSLATTKPVTFVRIDKSKQSSAPRRLCAGSSPLRLQAGAYNLEISDDFSPDGLLAVLRVLRRV